MERLLHSCRYGEQFAPEPEGGAADQPRRIGFGREKKDNTGKGYTSTGYPIPRATPHQGLLYPEGHPTPRTTLRHELN